LRVGFAAKFEEFETVDRVFDLRFAGGHVMQDDFRNVGAVDVRDRKKFQRCPFDG